MIVDQYVLLDTCILSYLLSKEVDLARRTSDLLELLTQNGNSLYISEFTHYELLRGATEKQKAKFDDLLNKLKTIENNKSRMNRAIKLHNAYNKNEKIKKILHSISDCDIFIGALIFGYQKSTNRKPYLLTADYFDFPRPLFVEKEIFKLEFTKNKSTKTSLYYYLLEANLDELF